MEQISFTDSNGVPWTVREDGADDSLASGRGEHFPGTKWLRFESDLEVRRLWHYPDDWRGLSPLQLESLLERASTVIARFRPVATQRVGVVPNRDGPNPDGAPGSAPAATAPDRPRQHPSPPVETLRSPGHGKPARHDDH